MLSFEDVSNLKPSICADICIYNCSKKDKCWHKFLNDSYNYVTFFNFDIDSTSLIIFIVEKIPYYVGVLLIP